MTDRIRFGAPFVLAVAAFAASAHALSQGPNFSGVEAACTFQNCGASDGSPDSACSIGISAGQFIVVTDFGFNLPASTTSIDGFLVEVKAMSDNGCSPTVQLQAPALVGTSRALAATPVSTLCSASDFRSAGGATDTFDAPLTVADVNDFSFGVRVNRCSTVGVDAVKVTIFYTIGTPVCGDGVQTGAEQCDDGDTDRGDGCSAKCQTEQALDADAQDCVNRTNKNGAKVVTAVGKLADTCVKATSKGDVTDPDACLAADAKGTVAKAAAKLAADDAVHCAGGASFGYTSAATATSAMDGGMRALVHDLYGPLLTGVIGTAPAGTCQEAVLKSLQKLLKAKTTLFLKCKKDGLKGKPFVQVSGADLEGCFDPLTADVQGKIAKAVAALKAIVDKKCVGVPFFAAFPGPCSSAGDSTALAACIDRQAECRTCQLFDGADGLTRDCDLFDDGVANASCP